MVKIYNFGLSLLFCLLFLSVQAQEDMITDRPDQTESAIVIPLSHFQFETGLILSTTVDDNSSSTFASLFRYGIHERIELRLVSSLENLTNSALAEPGYLYLNDMEVGTKIQLVKTKVQLAVLSHVKLPIGSDEVSLDAYGFNNRICFSHGITDRIGIGYNLGNYYVQDQINQIFGTISAGFSLTDRVGFFLEWYGQSEEDSELQVSFDTGFTYLYKDNLQFDIEFGYALNENPSFFGFGVSWRTPN